jgi:hypothetical protein
MNASAIGRLRRLPVRGRGRYSSVGVLLRSGLLAPILAVGVLTAGPAAADPACEWSPDKSQKVDPASTEAAAILKPAVDDLNKKLGKPAQLGQDNIAKSGQWAFVRASILGADGQPIDYTGTPFAEAAEHGGKSKTYLALLRQANRGWNLVDAAIGPTDAVYEGWPGRFGSPPVRFVCQ